MTRALRVLVLSLLYAACAADVAAPNDPPGGVDGSPGGKADDPFEEPGVFPPEPQECPAVFDGCRYDNVPSDPPVEGDYELAFSDDFRSGTLDDARWVVGQHWAGINGAASNDPANIESRCGCLAIHAERRDNHFAGRDFAYASGEVSTFRRFRQRYGYFEARIRYDDARGLWPAFWLMPDRGRYGNVSANGSALLKFDLEGIELGEDERAVLRLTVARRYGEASQNIGVFPVLDDDWIESEVTGERAPTMDPRWIENRFDPQLEAGDTLEIDVSDLVRQEAGGDGTMSVLLADRFMRSAGVDFHSRESQDRSLRPVLFVGIDALEPVADATLGEGRRADERQGDSTTLSVMDSWGNTASTHNGGMEFDIMESLGVHGSHWTSHALHWDGYGDEHQVFGVHDVDLDATDDGFHVYGMRWAPGVVEWYVDGVMTGRFEDARVSDITSYVIVSLQMGGWDGNGNIDEAAYPAGMVIDWVRVYRDAGEALDR
ncbi:MAG: family 16 glycosylhydrolase [Myxococcota bacterium]